MYGHFAKTRMTVSLVDVIVIKDATVRRQLRVGGGLCVSDWVLPGEGRGERSGFVEGEGGQAEGGDAGVLQQGGATQFRQVDDGGGLEHLGA